MFCAALAPLSVLWLLQLTEADHSEAVLTGGASEAARLNQCSMGGGGVYDCADCEVDANYTTPEAHAVGPFRSTIAWQVRAAPLASKLAEANQPVACPPQWLPVFLTKIPMPPTHHRRLLNNIFTSKAVLAANADSEELAADLLDTEGQGSALRSVMAHRGSRGFEAMLLAQLDTATKEARLPCSVQQGVNWPLAYLEPHATWGAASCLARCARHDKCVAYGFAPPPKDSELPGRRARLST